MSYATTSVATPSFPYLVGPSTIVSGAIAQFQTLSTADKLAVLHSIYTHIAPATPEVTGTARFHLVGGLLATVLQMTSTERKQALHALVAKENNSFCRAYGLLGTRTKFAVWDLLWKQVNGDSSWGTTHPPVGSEVVQTLIDTIAFKFDSEQKMNFIRQVVADTGIDPLA